jgi:hypothetical protein
MPPKFIRPSSRQAKNKITARMLKMSEFVGIFREHGEDPIARFDEVLKEEGPDELLLLMDVYINGLSILYTEKETGTEFTAEQMVNNARRLGLRYRLNDRIIVPTPSNSET